MSNPQLIKRLATTAVAAAALTAPAAAAAHTAPSAAAALAAPTAAVAALPPVPRETLQHDADALLRQGAPGVLASVQDASGTVAVRSGYANVKTRRRVDWNTHFRIGSMTKPFVATTVLQLVGEGRLSLDDTVDRWLPGLVSGHGNDGRAITIRQLLQHTSGLPNYTASIPWLIDGPAFARHRFDTVTATQAVRLAVAHKPMFAPGTSWTYSNTNYALAGLVIRAVTGRPWQDEVRDRIVTPLHLTATTLPGTDPGLPAPHAIGYDRFPGRNATSTDPDYGPIVDSTRMNPSWGGAAGEMISTTADTNRFLRALVGGELLQPAQLAEMQRTVSTRSEPGFAANWPGSRYGLGLMRLQTSCGPVWSHGGDIDGFMTRDAVTPDGSRAVTITINNDALQRRPGVPAPKEDVTTPLIDHALCG
jgi:D-alanyl-D-alanine carboxypeptidase